MPGYLRYSVLLLLSLDGAYSTSTQNGSGSASPSASESTGSTSSALSTSNSSQTATTNHATCPSRTANYITHTLPQQCLRTNRASVATADAHNGTSSTSVTASLPPDQPEGGKPAETHVTSLETASVSSSDTSSMPNTETTEAGSVTSAASDIPPSAAQEPEAETDSPLDNANFLSFEDWKRQNLVKAGQSPDNIGARSQALDGERKRPGINNALDTLGEESEIELDFSGFGASHDDSNREPSSADASGSVDAQASLAPHSARSKDAGKTCKERTNYASFDCAATILKNNPESKSVSSVLVENKDSYMLNKCSADNKFVIVELCSDILVDTIVLANYEFFSSIFRHFRISVSDRYPVKMEKWKDLGTFEARNTRELQAFLVENPLIWARYLRIEFLTHYGNEYYCPVSLLRVHGTTMMDEFRHQEEIARGETQDDEIVAEADVSAPAQTTVSQEPASVSSEVAKGTVQATANAETKSLETSTGSSPESPSEQDLQTTSTGDPKASLYTCQVQPILPWNHSSPGLSLPTCAKDDLFSKPRNATTGSSSATHTRSSPEELSTSATHAAATTTESKPAAQITTSSERPNTSNSSVAVQDDTSSGTSYAGQSGDAKNTPISNTSRTPTNTVTTSPTSRPRDDSTATSPSRSSGQGTNSTRTPPGSTSAQPAQPSTQESFFKSVHKRLQQLESNSTLSLQYIEEQSRILRDAFSKVEKRQVTATSNFLSHLNSTVMGELQGFRQAYDQLWQSTVIELEGQREQYQREMLALSTRLTLVADELVWQKRMGIVQSTLLLLCLALVLFNRTGNSALVEMPLLQQMMNKSQAALRAGWESPTGSRSPDNRSPENRSPENRSPVSLFRKKLWRHSTEPVSGHATDFTDSRPQSRDATHARPDVTLEAPTPPSADSDSEDEGSWKEVPEVQSGPATPRGTREALGSPTWVGDSVFRPSSSMG